MSRGQDALEDRVVSALKGKALIRDRVGGWRSPATKFGALVAAMLIVAVLASVAMRDRKARPIGETYMLALYDGPQFRPPAGASLAAEYAGWARSHVSGPAAVIGGEELGPATEVLGPMEPADPGLAGYFLVRAHSRGQAVALAKTLPHLRYGGTIVVRKVIHHG